MIGGRGLLVGRDRNRGRGRSYGIEGERRREGGSGVYDIVEERRVVFIVLLCMMEGEGDE